MKNKSLLAAVLLAAFGVAAGAAEAKIKVGSPAPKLQVGKWIQGEPVKEIEKGKAYIVEFWATWCGPCKVSIPHLNELHEKFKDKGLIVIGQDVWERNEDEVPKFVKQMGEKMTYRVALDLKSDPKDKGAMAATWMEAAGQNGIPAAFVIDKKQTIVWIGHPMELDEKMLDGVLNGTFDVKKAVAEAEAKAKNEGAMQELGEKFSNAMNEGKGDEAEAALKEIEKLLPEAQRKMMGATWFAVYCKKKDYATAYKVAKEVSDANEGNAMLQNQLAWQILTDKSIEKRDLALAETFARRGVKATKDQDASIMDTLARALFMQDKKAEAIEVQEKAVAAAKGPLKKQLQDSLDSYKQGKLPADE
jgi:thiol-disulfide isomerase/thioredoxin